MTPFGVRIRQLRRRKGVTQKEMARDLGVSAAWLSALEHGKRGQPNWQFVQRIIGYFNIIWEEADELAVLSSLSHPRIVVDTSELSPRATELANLLADRIAGLDGDRIESMIALLREDDPA